MRRTLLIVSLIAGSTFLLKANSNAAEAPTGGNQATGQQEGLGMIPSDARFLRENRDPGQIVGGTAVGVGALRDQTGQTGQAGQMQGFQRTQTGFNMGGFNARGFNQFGSFGQMGQLGRMFGGAMNTRGARTRENLRTSVELGFQAPAAPTPSAVSSRVQTRIARIPKIQEMGSINVQMEGQTAVLQGQVASAQDRDLVARMLLLEPGISDVRNELTLGTSNDSAAQP
jgi:osmotically-inducible protein OsmY